MHAGLKKFLRSVTARDGGRAVVFFRSRSANTHRPATPRPKQTLCWAVFLFHTCTPVHTAGRSHRVRPSMACPDGCTRMQLRCRAHPRVPSMHGSSPGACRRWRPPVSAPAAAAAGACADASHHPAGHVHTTPMPSHRSRALARTAACREHGWQQAQRTGDPARRHPPLHNEGCAFAPDGPLPPARDRCCRAVRTVRGRRGAAAAIAVLLAGLSLRCVDCAGHSHRCRYAIRQALARASHGSSQAALRQDMERAACVWVRHDGKAPQAYQPPPPVRERGSS
jgi:hypothetical protein